MVAKADQERKAAIIRAEGEAEAAELISKAMIASGTGMIEVGICVYVHLVLYVCMYGMYIRLCVLMCMYVCMYVRLCVYVCVCMCMYVCMYVCI